MNAEFIENMSIPLLKMDKKEITKRYQFFDPTDNEVERFKFLKNLIPQHFVKDLKKPDQKIDGAVLDKLVFYLDFDLRSMIRNNSFHLSNIIDSVEKWTSDNKLKPS